MGELNESHYRMSPFLLLLSISMKWVKELSRSHSRADCLPSLSQESIFTRRSFVITTQRRACREGEDCEKGS